MGEPHVCGTKNTCRQLDNPLQSRLKKSKKSMNF